MGAVTLGAFGIVVRGRMVAVTLTRPAALRRLRREQENDRDARLVELYWSTGLLEDV